MHKIYNSAGEGLGLDMIASQIYWMIKFIIVHINTYVNTDLQSEKAVSAYLYK